MICLNVKENAVSLRNKEYILDSIILLVIIQIARVIIKYILLSQFNFTLENLNIINKRTNHVNEYKEAIKKIQDRGIKILGSFIFGLDQDTSDIFEKTLKFVEDTEISLPAFNILTPYPGTRIAKELEKDGRIFSYDWSDYTATKAVFVPKKMTVDELNEGYKWIYATVHQDINLKKL